VPDVISDTSPIQYLFQVGLLNLLFTLYEEVIIPEAVNAELDEGRRHGIELPEAEVMAQFTVRTVGIEQKIALPTTLGSGEKEVLALAAASPSCLVLIDDGLARQHALRLGLRFTGTLGVLLKSKQSGLLIEIRSVLDKLEAKGFRIDEGTRTLVLKLAQES